MKVRRLSHKKIQVEQTLPILCNGNKLGEVSIYQRYKLEDNFAYLIYSEKLINKISQQYKIKKKFISFEYSNSIINLDEQLISTKLASTIVFNDLIWYRDFKIKQIVS